MIISHVIGGLGNQMFQYAMGKALSLKHGVPLLVDVSGYANYDLHQGFELQRIFNCTASISDSRDVRKILGWQSVSSIRKIVSRPSMAALRSKTFVVEPHFHYWSAIENTPSNCYLVGYWQSEKYFLEVASEIRKEFSFKSRLEGNNAKIARELEQRNAVSLHVRRGDYVASKKNRGIYEVCSIEYYRKSIEAIADRVDSPCFYIFSDDIAWVRKNLKIDYSHYYVENNHGEESYNDMRLMSLCDHHIIANSSFSWWGAWLNSKTDKLVVAPKNWFVNSTSVKDLLPSDWLKL